MGLSFAFPAAFWGLLGLPLIVAIHFLQSRNRQAEVSSLFLLERLPEETRSGAVFSYLRNGLQLWMQLLAVLLFTLILSRPMWLHEESLQSVAVVLDSSVSMRAFKSETQAALEQITRDFDRSAGKTEWWLLSSDPGRPDGAGAATREDFLQALADGEALSGPHSPRSALQRARQLVGPEGSVLYVSDHPAAGLPAGAVAVSVGQVIDNSGFTGIRFEGGGWQASLIHFGTRPVEKKVTVQFDAGPVETRTLRLEPGALGLLSGPLPSGFQKALLRLEDDGYLWDNVLPFVAPVEKSLAYSLQLKDERMAQWAEKLMQTLPGAVRSSAGQLSWHAGWPVQAQSATAAEIWWLTGEKTAPFSVVAPRTDPLTEGLNWDGFLALPYSGFLMRPEDEVLLWMGKEPLVLRRPSTEGVRLLMNFDFETSNAERFPSLLLLLHRFAKIQRDQQPSPYQTQLETRQQLGLPLQVPGRLTQTFESLEGQTDIQEGLAVNALRVPERPGFWTVRADERVLLRAGIYVGDVAEGNFLSARALDLPEDLVRSQRKRNSQRDFLLPLWFSLLVVAVALGWWSEKT